MNEPRPRAPGLAALTLLEARRLLLRRSYLALLALATLAPLLVALLIRAPLQHIAAVLHIPRRILENVWLAMLGSTQALGPLAAGGPVAAGLPLGGATAYAWIIAPILAATITAGDLAEGRLQLLAARPVTRNRLLAAKLLALEASLAALYLSSAASAYLAASIVFGPQSRPWLAPVYAAALAAAQAPLVLATMTIGLRLKRPAAAALLGILLYFAGSLASAAPMIAAIQAVSHGNPQALREALDQVQLLNMVEPLHAAPAIARTILDAAIAGLDAHPEIGITAALTVASSHTYAELLGYAAAAQAAATATLYAAALLAFRRQTL